MSHPYYVICDLDGCLSDDRWRRHLLPEHPTQQSDWNEYHLRCGEDGVVHETLRQVRECCTDDLTGECRALLLLVTARPRVPRVEELTKDWVKRNLGGLKTHLIMRAAGCMLPSPEYKFRALNNFFSKEFKGVPSVGWNRVVAAFEDRGDVLPVLPIREDAKRQVFLDPPEEAAPKLLSVLESMAQTARERGGTYGEAYLAFGKLAMALWPAGLRISTEEDFVRHGVMMQVLNKLLRYAAVDGGHKDSAHDLAVYAAMLESVTK